MDTLIQGAVRMLQQEVAADTAIQIDFNENMMQDLVSLLHSYEIAETKKLTIMGGIMLLQLAARKHRELAMDDSIALTRGILDGDYFFGLYYRIMMRYSELKLLTFLSPIHKKIQIRAVYGQSTEQLKEELMERVRQYLNEQYRVGGDTDEAA